MNECKAQYNIYKKKLYSFSVEKNEAQCDTSDKLVTVMCTPTQCAHFKAMFCVSHEHDELDKTFY